MADYTIGPQRRSITCHHCRKTSYNSQDVVNLFCGFCNRFHLDQAIEQPAPGTAPTPDNSVYVKSGQHSEDAISYFMPHKHVDRETLEQLYPKSTERKTMSAPYTATQVRQMQDAAAKQSVDRQRIEKLAETDATIRACLVMVRNGVLSYEQALEGLVVLLHQQKEAAVAYATDLANVTPTQMVMSKADANQLGLDLAPGRKP